MAKRMDAMPRNGRSRRGETDGRDHAKFAFDGTSSVETIAGWLKEARTVGLVCCLKAGCVQRTRLGGSVVAAQDDALFMFSERIRGAIRQYERRTQGIPNDYANYDGAKCKPFWDSTEYEPPSDITPDMIEWWKQFGK